MVFQFVSFHGMIHSIFLGTELQLWDIERHQWRQVKATVESPGPGMECWRHGGEMEGRWIVTVHVVSVVTLPPTQQEPARTLSLGFLQASSYLTLSRAAETQPG